MTCVSIVYMPMPASNSTGNSLVSLPCTGGAAAFNSLIVSKLKSGWTQPWDSWHTPSTARERMLDRRVMGGVVRRGDLSQKCRESLFSNHLTSVRMNQNKHPGPAGANFCSWDCISSLEILRAADASPGSEPLSTSYQNK